jgi:hypothetical protein
MFRLAAIGLARDVGLTYRHVDAILAATVALISAPGVARAAGIGDFWQRHFARPKCGQCEPRRDGRIFTAATARGVVVRDAVGFAARAG